MSKKWCKDCGGTYDEGFFDRCRGDTHLRRPVCTLCHQTRSDNRKHADRWLVKARDTVRHHIKSLGRSRELLIEKFGWDVYKMARDAEHAFKYTCDYCGTLFEKMGHGLNDITLDIVNIKKDPYYNVNTKWVCRTCNSRKKEMSPCQWGDYMQYKTQWKAQKKKIEKNPLLALPMFEWSENK